MQANNYWSSSTNAYDSYACRKDKGTHKAVARVEQFIRQLSATAQPSYFLQLDIHNFFY